MAQKKDSDRGTGLGFVLWLLAAVLLLILFLMNQGRIFSNLKSTGFFDRVFGKTPAFVENAEITAVDSAEKNDVQPETASPITFPDTPYGGQGASGIVSQNEAAAALAQSALAAQQAEPPSPAAPEQDDAAVQPPAGTSLANAGKTMNLKLFFMTINSGGTVSRKEVTRTMRKTESPLADAVKALIAGPDVTEATQGCRTLVSAGTELLGASVKDGVATLNFSAEFEFNQYGIEGLRGQLQQIVYTATAFPTVQSVQFLVDGEKKEYLGSEGVWIGTPLTRNSF